MFENIRVFVCGRRLKRKIKISFHREFSGMDALTCVSRIALLIHGLSWKHHYTINIAVTFLRTWYCGVRPRELT